MKDSIHSEYSMRHKKVVRYVLLFFLGALGGGATGVASAAESCVVNIEPTDGCSKIGEQVKDVVTAFGTNFAASCDQHDICYRKIGTSVSMCDAELLSNARKACIAGSGGSLPSLFSSVILSCGLPGMFSDEGTARLAPDSPVLYDDFWSSLRDVVVQPVKLVVDLGKSVGTELVKGASSAASSIAAEYHRADDNAKKFRDNTVNSLIDGLETVEGVLETIPGGTFVLSIVGRPSELLGCVYEETMEFARGFDLLGAGAGSVGSALASALNPLSGVTYPACVIGANALYRGPQIYEKYQKNRGETTVYEGRQEDSLKEALRLATLEGCSMTAEESGLFRPVTNDAIITNTIRSIFMYMVSRPANETEYDYVRRHALADSQNWQFNLINALDTGSSLASLPMVPSYERTRPGVADIAFRSAVLADYSAIESMAAKRVIHIRAAKIISAL